jgi:dephospho-CoA kinase
MAESKVVIGVAGRIGSGKTAVAHHLERASGFRYYRYSLVLAEWFKTDPQCKAVLQELGWGVMSGDRQRELNRLVIAGMDADHDCVVDGLRHLIDFESLMSTFAARFAMAYIEASPESRFKRLSERFTDYEEFLIADSHPVEASIQELKPLAEIVLNGDLPFPELALQMSAFVTAFRLAQN